MTDHLDLNAVRHRSPLQALGAASLFLSQVEPFSNYRFGTWVDTLKGQILRNHYFFNESNGQIVGYYGWALVSHEVARLWIDNVRELTYEECLDGPCVLVMCNRALSRQVMFRQLAIMRSLIASHEMIYWKRQTPHGTRLVKFNLQAPGTRRPPASVPIQLVG